MCIIRCICALDDIFDINIVCPYEICEFIWFLIFDLMNVTDTQSLRMLNFANSTVGYEN